jgi:hypothetical protein
VSDRTSAIWLRRERRPEVKVMILVNRRIGETQTWRRLRGEDFQPSADSRHDLTVKTALLPTSA